MQELPDIPMSAEAQVPNRPMQSGRSSFPAASIGFAVISSFITLAICVGMVMKGSDSIKSLFGVKAEPRSNPLVMAIEEVKAAQIRLSAEIDSLKESLVKAKSSMDDQSFASSKLETRTMNLERFVTALEDKIKEQKKQAVVVQKEKEKAVIAKVQAEKLLPLILLSIRQQAGVPLVALRDGMETSELLMPGDSWRGWTFVDADPRTKIARFQVNGKPQELRL